MDRQSLPQWRHDRLQRNVHSQKSVFSSCKRALLCLIFLNTKVYVKNQLSKQVEVGAGGKKLAAFAGEHQRVDVAVGQLL